MILYVMVNIKKIYIHVKIFYSLRHFRNETFKYIFRKDLQVVNYFCKEILSLRIIYNHV